MYSKRARIEEGHLGAALDRRLANAMRQHRHFMTQIRADDQHALERSTSAIFKPEAGEGRLMLLRAEIQLAQAMIDVAAAQAARDLREQIQLLDASPSARPGIPGSPRHAPAAAFCSPSAAAVSATSQSTGLQRAVDAQHGLRRPDRREYMPSNPKRSRSAIQVSLISSFSRGTMRISLPRSTCAYRLVPKASCGDTSACWVISQARA